MTIIKAVIFDLDGVIADSEPLSAKGDDIVLARYGIEKTAKEKEQSFGRRGEEIFGDVLRARKRKIKIKKLMEEKNDVFMHLIKGHLKPIKKSLELIGFFKKNGFKLALATSSHSEKMMAELKELGISNLFKIKITGDDVRLGKPNPEIYLKAAKKLRVKPEQCAVIEDSASGVEAAKRAGMLAIGFASPNSRGQDLSRADIIVDDLALVKIYFGKIGKGGKGGLKQKIRVAAISDTHLGLKDEIPERIINALGGVDLILHTGDILDLSVIRRLQKIAPVVAVHGDSDPKSVKEGLPGSRFFRIFRFKIGMVHNAGIFGTWRALSIAKRNKCDILVYGHSHLPAIKKKEGTWLINSGSPTMPLLAILIKRTIAILEISKTGIKPRLVKV